MEEITITFWHWLILAMVLLVIELMTGTVFFLWITVACIAVAGVVALSPQMIWQYQLAWAAGFIILSIYFWYLWYKHSKSENPGARKLNRRAEQYVGRKFTLTESIVNGTGQIKVDDSVWRVTGEDTEKGSSVTVIEAKGMILKVKTNS